MMRFFHVSIVWGETSKGLEQLRGIFNDADDWITYGGSNWILYTSDEIYTWQARLVAVIDQAKDSFFICEILNIDFAGGWMPRWVWD